MKIEYMEKVRGVFFTYPALQITRPMEQISGTSED